MDRGDTRSRGLLQAVWDEAAEYASDPAWPTDDEFQRAPSWDEGCRVSAPSAKRIASLTPGVTTNEDSEGKRQVVLIDLDQGWEWPGDADIDWYTAFLAVDAEGVSKERIASLANAMLERRCAYVSVWGSDCDRVHDVFDQVYIADPSHPSAEAGEWSQMLPFLMSTWHERESLASGLWFALHVATPSSDGYWESRTPTFAAFTQTDYRASVRGLLLDRDRLEAEADDGTEG